MANDDVAVESTLAGLEKTLSILVVHPGDGVLLLTEGEISEELALIIRDQVKVIMPGVHVLVGSSMQALVARAEKGTT